MELATGGCGAGRGSRRRSSRRGHDGVDEHLVAVLVDAGAVAAEHHRQAVGGQAHAAQRPHVVVVERGGAQPHGDPAVGHRRVGPLPDLETRQRVVGGLADGVAASMQRPYRGGGRAGSYSDSRQSAWPCSRTATSSRSRTMPRKPPVVVNAVSTSPTSAGAVPARFSSPAKSPRRGRDERPAAGVARATTGVGR